MTDRNFTPPTEFPARYVTSDGHEAVVLGKRPGDVSPYVGYIYYESRSFPVATWRSDGSYLNTGENRLDLHDLPKKQVRWANDYGRFPGDLWCKTRREADEAAGRERIAVIRREWVEGQPPQYFAEDV